MPIFQVHVLYGRSREKVKGLIADETEAAVKNLSGNNNYRLFVVTN